MKPFQESNETPQPIGCLGANTDPHHGLATSSGRHRHTPSAIVPASRTCPYVYGPLFHAETIKSDFFCPETLARKRNGQENHVGTLRMALVGRVRTLCAWVHLPGCPSARTVRVGEKAG